MKNQLWEFIRAASPWAAMGLLLIIIFARITAKNANKKDDDKQDSDYGTEGMCLGMCFGPAPGTAFENNPGIGISLGMPTDLAIGSLFRKNQYE